MTRATPSPVEGGYRWLLLSGVVGALGGLRVIYDSLLLLRREHWGAGGLGWFGWLQAAVGIASVAAGVFTVVRRRWAWGLLMGLGALWSLFGLLVLLGRQPLGGLIALIGAAVMFGLWQGRSALLARH